MDVHAPHEPLHTWRDFWIHLGTITIGLLIAISLEQSVEGLHHLHQRHQLEQDLRAEGERNIEIVAKDAQVLAATRAWELSLRKNVDAVRASGGKAGPAYVPNPVPGQPTVPTDSVWTTAKESMLVVLLPRGEAEMYSRLDLQHKLMQDRIDHWLEVKTEVKEFEDNFDDGEPGSTPDLSRMSAEELHSYSMLLTKEVAARDDVASRLSSFVRLDRAVLEGARTEMEMIDKAQKL
ncbi:hypothetical protein [Granulicella sp. L46]|uniref:hypothetical protein n=1 Tax=Granulicella sp. L46 TaxID=1641865 RepID=UPI00131D20B8|nr:hypothetical protein [Granulicella sp. L46]